MKLKLFFAFGRMAGLSLQRKRSQQLTLIILSAFITGLKYLNVEIYIIQPILYR